MLEISRCNVEMVPKPLENRALLPPTPSLHPVHPLDYRGSRHPRRTLSARSIPSPCFVMLIVSNSGHHRYVYFPLSSPSASLWYRWYLPCVENTRLYLSKHTHKKAYSVSYTILVMCYVKYTFCKFTVPQCLADIHPQMCATKFISFSLYLPPSSATSTSLTPRVLAVWVTHFTLKQLVSSGNINCQYVYRHAVDHCGSWSTFMGVVGHERLHPFSVYNITYIEVNLR